jgi:ribonuclease BN (tRNA processing enzyme)
MQRHVDFTAIDAVVISHCHPDHWTDLPVLRNVLKYVVHRAGVPVYGTAETQAMAEAATHDGLAPTFDWHVIVDGAAADIAGLRFSFSRTDHPVETLAVRVEDPTDGTALAYSADTGPGWSVSSFDAPVDLFVCEATLTTAEEGLAPHISARQAGAMAAAAGVRRLLLTHHWPGGDVEAQRAAAADTFGGPVDIATINERYPL